MSKLTFKPHGAVGDCTEKVAFIANKDGYDIANLHRVVGNPEHNPSDAEWQSLIDLVNAAPALLAALRDLCDAYAGTEDGSDSQNCLDAYGRALLAIASASGRKR